MSYWNPMQPYGTFLIPVSTTELSDMRIQISSSPPPTKFEYLLCARFLAKCGEWHMPALKTRAGKSEEWRKWKVNSMADFLFFTLFAYISLSLSPSSQLMEYGNSTDPCHLFLHKCAGAQRDHQLNGSLWGRDLEYWKKWKFNWNNKVGGAWLAQSVEHRTLGFSSGCDVRVLKNSLESGSMLSPESA